MLNPSHLPQIAEMQVICYWWNAGYKCRLYVIKNWKTEQSSTKWNATTGDQNNTTNMQQASTDV